MKPPDMNAELLQLIYENPWLTERERRIFYLRYKEDMLNYQIAIEMNCSKETIGRILKKVYRKTEPIITEYHNTHSPS